VPGPDSIGTRANLRSKADRLAGSIPGRIMAAMDRNGSALTDRGSTTRWRNIQRRILDRDGWSCQVPDQWGILCGRVAVVCGHIIARSDRPDGMPGVDALDNLRAECTRCSTARGARLGRRASGRGRRAEVAAATIPPYVASARPAKRSSWVVA
jgi:hypothetical protein